MLPKLLLLLVGSVILVFQVPMTNGNRYEIEPDNPQLKMDLQEITPLLLSLLGAQGGSVKFPVDSAYLIWRSTMITYHINTTVDRGYWPWFRCSDIAIDWYFVHEDTRLVLASENCIEI